MTVKRIPRFIGHAEGGQHLPELENLLDGIVDDLIENYKESGADPTKRKILKHDEEYLTVTETDPAEGDEEVAIDDNIEITFDRDIVDNSPEGDDIEDAITVQDEDEAEATITSTSISDNVLTIVIDGDMNAGKEYTVTIEKDGTVRADDNGLGLAEDFVLTFNTAE